MSHINKLTHRKGLGPERQLGGFTGRRYIMTSRKKYSIKVRDYFHPTKGPRKGHALWKRVNNKPGESRGTSS